ncbi:SdiA-regulated domain-containing protein [Luteolibacter soli]|uniref:SdiA-regulated domain-containing protein n=1 Tax=Luteolibacter soli TaxID=3135280 RepID=A0ABU9AMM6_9BACT
MTPSPLKSSTPSISSLSGLSSLTALLGFAAGGIATAAPFTTGNVVIYRAGTGTGSLVNTGNPVFLDEYTPAGALVQSIPMPTAVSGSDKRLVVSGTASSEGMITRSADGRYLLATGYDAPIPTTGVASTPAATTNRVVARVDGSGIVSTSTALTDAPTGNNIRGAASNDGTSVWVSGGSNGVRYAPTLATTTSTDLSSASLANSRVLSIFGGQLYASASSGTNTFKGVSTVGTGLPTSTGQTVTRLPGLTDTLCPSSYAFFLADLDAGVSGVDTLYIADDTTTGGGRGGVQKYSLVSGTWTANGIAGSGADSYRGLTAKVSGSTVTLFATRKGGTGATGGGELVSLVDSSGYNATITATPTLLATATANTAFRGIALAPVAPVTSVDLSKYVRVGRYDLPEPTRTTAPADNLLCQEASGVAYNWDTGTLFIVGDGGKSVTEVSKTGALVSTMNLALGASSQGTEFFDTEGITYIGGGQFVMTEERDRQAVKFTYVAGGTLTRAAAQTVKLGTTIGNVGLEGVSYDPQTSGFIFSKELEPEGLFQTTIDFAAGTASNGSPTTVNSTNLFNPALANLEDMSDVFAFSNLPSMTGQPQAGNLLILSQESGMIRNVDRSGNISSTLTLVSDAGNPMTIQNQTHEGVTMDRDGNIYVVSENGGGDADHPQLWVFSPSTATNVAPTVLALSTPSATIPEDTSTTVAIKVANIVVTDDGLGVNQLSVSGADAAFFEIIGSGLYLKAGTVLNFDTKSTYNVTVNVDDTTVGATPDALASFTLNISDVVNNVSAIRVTEVAPWSSGNSAVAADWFELTNTGSSAVNITGWKMYDSSGGFGSAGPLSGVTSIAPGESVIFVDGASKVAGFSTNWFGANPPSGLQIGSYSGPGLSTGGDAVTIYDPTGLVMASVTFGASTPVPGPYLTFDNTAGLDATAISALSAIGQNGAFYSAATTNEIGSPGSAVLSTTPVVSITATDANASETGPDAGTFRITRTGSTISAMNVVYTIATGAGQATSDDYTPVLTSPAIIPAGESFVDITITPVDDSSVEGAETVVLNLNDTGSYDVGSPGSATVTIGDNDVANSPPTLVALNNTVTVLKDSTSTSSPIKVADIVVTDDGHGTNDLSLAGADASFFEITGGALYLKAGTSLSYATKASYAVTVNVDDTAVGLTPDLSVNFTLGIVPSTIFITEVHPNGSSASYGADWFEVTNTGSTAVNISGWQMDDSSNGTGKLVLRGVTSIPAGKSAIFFEGIADGTTDATIKANFSTAWFGSATPPAGVLIGAYGGSGAGLSGSGDAVNVFDSAGNRVAGVSFGSSTASASTTFDNQAGLGTINLPLPAISTLSVIGTHGGFRSANNLETGSPGTIINNSGSFPAWLASNGYTSLGFDLDSDNDGLSDGMEYFFNLNPNNAGDYSNLPQVTSNGGALQLGYTLLNNAYGVAGSLQTSSDLDAWTPALPGLDYTLASSVVNGDEIALTYNLPGTGPSAPSPSSTYLAPNAADPAGASLGGVRVVNEGLVGVGRLSGENVDKFGETQGASSGVIITNWGFNDGHFNGTFNVLPDRGHGDGTSNYAARLHKVDFTFAPYYGAGPVPQNQVQMTYVDSTKFTYQDGATVKFTTGLNPSPTGNKTLFGQTVGTVQAANGPGGAQEDLLCIDSEAVYLFPDGSGYFSDEYGTYIVRFDATKKITGMTQLPGAAQPFRPAGTPNFDSVTAPTTGRRNNQGLEGMSVSPDGTLLFAMLQSATVQDTNGAQQQTRNNARLFVYNIVGPNRENPQIIGEYVVKLPQIDLNPNAAPSALDGTAAQSEIVALSNSSFLMLPRDANGLGKLNSTAITFKSVQLVDFASATNILGQYDGVTDQISPGGVLRPEIKAAATGEVINMLEPTDLAKFGLNTTIPANANTLNEKIEGMALVPDLSTPAANDFFLFVGNDNDFESSDVQMLNAAGNVVSKGDGRLTPGITNDAMFYVWRLTIDAGQKKFFRMDVTHAP